MSTKEKLIERFKNLPSDFTFDELVRLLSFYGYQLDNKGQTSGSRVGFFKENDLIRMHKPHPGNIIGRKTLKAIYKRIKYLKPLWDN